MTVIARVTSVVRLFDLRLASNRFVLAAVAVATVCAFGFGRDGVAAGLTVFLAWALARELDPDRAAAATIAALVGFGLFLMVDPVHLLAMATLLFAVRLMAGTTGAPPTWFDLIWLPALGALSAQTFDGFLCGLALSVAIACGDSGRRALQALSAVAAACGAAIVALVNGALVVRPAAPSGVEWLVIAACVLAVPALRLPPPVSVSDRSAIPLSATRLVRSAPAGRRGGDARDSRSWWRRDSGPVRPLGGAHRDCGNHVRGWGDATMAGKAAFARLAT